MFSFVQKDDQNLPAKDLPIINDLQNPQRLVQFSLAPLY
jgi:hypothetical protein